MKNLVLTQSSISQKISDLNLISQFIGEVNDSIENFGVLTTDPNPTSGGSVIPEAMTLLIENNLLHRICRENNWYIVEITDGVFEIKYQGL